MSALLAAILWVRIGVADAAPALAVGTARAARIVGANGLAIPLEPRDRWVARADGKALRFEGPSGQWVEVTAPARIIGPGPVYAGRHWYRGSLELRVGPAPAGEAAGSVEVTAIDRLPLEQYLRGVVPAEMPSSWPLAALEAQAVAARTYTIAHLGDFAARGYDLAGSVLSQAYGGLDVEATASDEAVARTAGEILTYAGAPINAYYCAAAGGYTEDAASVWGFGHKLADGRVVGYPYLKPVADFDWASPHWSWRTHMSSQALAQRLAAAGIGAGTIDSVAIASRSVSGRAAWIAIEGRAGCREVPGQVFRLALGLQSTLFSLEPAGDGWDVVGRGWGHGVGMSQWGAWQMATWGFGFPQILAHYYPGAKLSLWPGPQGAISHR